MKCSSPHTALMSTEARVENVTSASTSGFRHSGRKEELRSENCLRTLLFFMSTRDFSSWNGCSL